MGAYYSYTDFKKDRLNFVRVDGEGPGRYDTPANVYFKIAFYFTDNNGLLGSAYDLLCKNGGSDASYTTISKLNAPYKETRNAETKFTTDRNSTSSVLNPNNVGANSAYNFLILNNELERAKLLKQFITLLSEISSNSPWYFNSISGLDTALERKYFAGEEFKLEDKPNQITIKCLNDALDNRIGVLLDLYRTICFSYRNKKEIVPANLRKFNMGVILFGTPLRGKTKSTNSIGTNVADSGIDMRMEIPQNAESYYIPNVKLIELQNCEIDYNSSKSGYGELGNDELNYQQYTITINYDNAFESRYNEQLQEVISDFINIDLGTESGNRELDGTFSDIDKHGTSIDDTTDLKVYNVVSHVNEDGSISDKKVDYKTTGKGYWTNRDWEQTGNYETKYSEKHEVKSEYAVNGSFLSSQFNSITSKVESAIQIPELNLTKENLAKNGTVNRIGKYQYLNFTSGTDGLLGSAVTLAGGLAVNGVVQAAKNVYLGNINGNSLSDVSRSVSNAINGNYQNIVQNTSSSTVQEDSTSSVGQKIYETQEEEKPKLSKKYLWEKSKTSALEKMSKAQSLYNNI